MRLSCLHGVHQLSFLLGRNYLEDNGAAAHARPVLRTLLVLDREGEVVAVYVVLVWTLLRRASHQLLAGSCSSLSQLSISGLVLR